MMRMLPKLHTYVVRRDFGFAPNPFYGFCTLATCKPRVRKSAAIGDWVVGTGSVTKWRPGQIVYAMRVSEAMTLQEYWSDPRFRVKRPNLRASLKKAFGDNMYYWNSDTEQWHQMDSHHSHEDGRQNGANIHRDTSVNRVLISEDFVYWGGDGPELLEIEGYRISKGGVGEKANFPYEVVQEFVDWVRSLGESGYCGTPLDWKRL